MSLKTTQRCSEGNNGTSSLPLCKKRGRYYVFTTFHKEPPAFTKKMKYLLFAPEICPETSRAHWQGYVVFKAARTIKAIQKEHKEAPFGFLAPAAGGIKHQLQYIRGPYDDGKGKTKPLNPDWKEFGDRPKGKGARTDLDALKDEVMNGKSVDDICVESPALFHQYGRTLTRLEDIALRRKYRKHMTVGTWYYGPTGVGKSHLAARFYSPETHYMWADDGEWHDNYTGQKTVIINDFRGNLPYGFLLNLVDKWDLRLRRRGRAPVPFLAERVIITSSLPPEGVYNNLAADDKIGQLLRRFEVKRIGMNPVLLLKQIKAYIARRHVPLYGHMTAFFLLGKFMH